MSCDNKVILPSLTFYYILHALIFATLSKILLQQHFFSKHLLCLGLQYMYIQLLYFKEFQHPKSWKKRIKSFERPVQLWWFLMSLQINVINIISEKFQIYIQVKTWLTLENMKWKALCQTWTWQQKLFWQLLVRQSRMKAV